jgi:hypothetical protein
VKEFALPYNNPTSIVSDGHNVWIGNWYTQTVYRYVHTIKQLQLVNNGYFSDFGPMALTQYENALWSIGNDLALRQHRINDQLDVIRKYQINEHTPCGIVIVANSLWLCDATSKKVYQYAVSDTLSAVRSFDCPVVVPAGMAWDGEYLWIAEAGANKLYLFKPGMRRLVPGNVYQIPKPPAGTLSGIYWCKKRLYTLFAGNPSRVHIYKRGELILERQL